MTARQVLDATTALGHEVVVDPELRPSGPVEEDVLELLGRLLRIVESEITARVDLLEDPHESWLQLQRGWSQDKEDPGLWSEVLAHRLRRTGFDIELHLAGVRPDDEEDAGPPGIAGASSCLQAAGNLMEAQQHREAGRQEHAQLSLDAAEGSLASVLLTVYLLRIQLRGPGAASE